MKKTSSLMKLYELSPVFPNFRSLNVYPRIRGSKIELFVERDAQ